MTTFDLGPARPTTRPADPAVHVRMVGDDVVLSVDAVLDRDATNALVASMNAAITSGCCVVLELDPVADGAPPAAPAAPVAVRQAETPASPDITAIGPGLIRIPTASRSWTVDVVRRRLCTSQTGTERRFVPPEAWVPIRSCRVSARSVAAVGAAGHDLVHSAQRPVA